MLQEKMGEEDTLGEHSARSQEEKSITSCAPAIIFVASHGARSRLCHRSRSGRRMVRNNANWRVI